MYKLNLYDKESFVIECMQYDSNFYVSCATNEDLTDKTVSVEIQTARGNVLLANATVLSDHSFRFLLDLNVTYKAGSYKAEVVVYDSEIQNDANRVAYYPITIVVNPSVKDNTSDPYETAISNAKKVSEEAGTTLEHVQETLTAVNDSNEAVNVATEECKTETQKAQEAYAAYSLALEAAKNYGTVYDAVKEMYDKMQNMDVTTLVKSMEQLQSKMESDYLKKSALLDNTYPVGAYYISERPTSPALLFGGEWVQEKDRFLLPSSSAGQTGGAMSVKYKPSGSVGSHALTHDEMPKHAHRFAVRRTRDEARGYGLYYSDGFKDRVMVSSTISEGCWSETQGNGKAHNHSFFGNTATISTTPAYRTVYCWRRVA